MSALIKDSKKMSLLMRNFKKMDLLMKSSDKANELKEIELHQNNYGRRD
jgi:hypothetical protein